MWHAVGACPPSLLLSCKPWPRDFLLYCIGQSCSCGVHHSYSLGFRFVSFQAPSSHYLSERVWPAIFASQLNLSENDMSFLSCTPVCRLLHLFPWVTVYTNIIDNNCIYPGPRVRAHRPKEQCSQWLPLYVKPGFRDIFLFFKPLIFSDHCYSSITQSLFRDTSSHRQWGRSVAFQSLL